MHMNTMAVLFQLYLHVKLSLRLEATEYIYNILTECAAPEPITEQSRHKERTLRGSTDEFIQEVILNWHEKSQNLATESLSWQHC